MLPHTCSILQYLIISLDECKPCSSSVLFLQLCQITWFTVQVLSSCSYLSNLYYFIISLDECKPCSASVVFIQLCQNIYVIYVSTDAGNDPTLLGFKLF